MEKEVVLRSGGPVMRVRPGQAGPTRVCYWPGDAGMLEDVFAVENLRLAFPHSYAQAFPKGYAEPLQRVLLGADLVMVCDRFDDLLVECMFFAHVGDDLTTLHRFACTPEFVERAGAFQDVGKITIDGFAHLNDEVVRARGKADWPTPEQQAWRVQAAAFRDNKPISFSERGSAAQKAARRAARQSYTPSVGG